MKNTAIKLAAFGTLLALAATTATVSAQQSNNLIEEVRISQTEDFTKLRDLIAQNFDFTDSNLTEGTTNTVVKFEISPSGKIENIHAESRCKYINKNLENTLSELHYRFKEQRERPYTYVMPVEIAIASR